MLFSLQHKTALVTGGASGIGESISKILAGAGARVYVLDLHTEKGEKVAETIRSEGGHASFVTADVTRQAELVGIYDRISGEAGRIDILVNSAGISHIGKLDTTSEEDFDRIYTVNVKGVYNSMYAAIGHMKKQGGGVIINIASVASLIGLPDRFAYSMSKGAVMNMTLTVARDYIGYNVRCNCIAPARIHTPFVDGFLAKNYPGQEQEMFDKLSKTQPIGRMGRPDEVAYMVLYLCSDEAGFVTGTNFPIDGGFINLNT